MAASTQGALPHTRHSGDSRWLTATVARFATALFAVSGSQILPYVVSGHSAPPSPELVSGFLLNIALLLFAWRRSVQLKESLAQQRAADLKDRKSTRLNSSHVKISYAVFCLKKKIKNAQQLKV